jgi:hypothetical protein
VVSPSRLVAVENVGCLIARTAVNVQKERRVTRSEERLVVMAKGEKRSGARMAARRSAGAVSGNCEKRARC